MKGIPRTTRRRALTVIASSLAIPAAALLARGLQRGPEAVRWQGEALGAVSAITLWAGNADHAKRTIRRLESEIRRLERIFSLFDRTSEISALNRLGYLARPSPDMLAVMRESRILFELSSAAFDPTIQPLWSLYMTGRGADRQAIKKILHAVDFSAIYLNRSAIRFEKPNMAISLNGIAQGYITDRISDLLRNEGYDQAMVELGETRALGADPDGRPFSVGLINPNRPSQIMSQIPLANASLSVSGGYGFSFPGKGNHHIFNPQTGRSANAFLQVAVTAPKAVDADGLSTALYVAGPAQAPDLIRAVPGAAAIVTLRDGTTLTL